MRASPLNWLSQLGAVTKFNLLTLPQRKGAVAAAAFGICGVVAVMVGVLSIAQGFQRAMTVAAAPDTAIVLRSGADTELVSILLGEDVRAIADAPGIARGPRGPLASSELFAIINLPKRSTGTDANVPLRGVQPAAFEVRPEVRLVAGRNFEMGRNEIIVGQGAAAEFAGLDLGATLKVGRNEWTVVGLFLANGGLPESEIWTDASVLQAAYQRGNSFQAVVVKLTSPAAFGSFKDALTADPRLNVKVLRVSEFYAEQSRVVINLITGLGAVISGLMGLGAVFGALNTMYAAVSARAREIATLRALGFGGGPVVVAVLMESLALALLGGALGSFLAYVIFDGFRAATMNWQSFSQVAFAFVVTPGLLVLGVLYAAAIGLIGGLLPACRAARVPVATALREL
jgi:putative ABC transport system permease protein